jgi:hypothetical protein
MECLNHVTDIATYLSGLKSLRLISATFYFSATFLFLSDLFLRLFYFSAPLGWVFLTATNGSNGAVDACMSVLGVQFRPRV